MDRIEVDGFLWYRQKATGHYRNNLGLTLHKWIFEKHHGPVPAGHVVHHKDHDKANNDPSNLESMPRGEHARMHSTLGNYGFKAMGTEWRSEHSKKQWAKKEPSTWICLWCGKAFESRTTKGIFCSGTCHRAQKRDDFKRGTNRNYFSPGKPTKR